MKLANLEYDECRMLWEWVSYQPLLADHMIKIVNEGRRHPITGHRLKLIGMRAGIPDYFLAIKNKTWAGCFIEMKKVDERGKKMRQEQVDWINRLINQGYYATFAFGFDDARIIILDYIGNRI